MNKTKAPQFIVAEIFSSENAEERRERLRRIIDGYLRARLRA